ncbi:MAG: hypothetical protein QOF40_3589, partial [Actinomycetota bacterium]|nr:hypothetical protein [Actinomycetota bacterium]
VSLVAAHHPLDRAALLARAAQHGDEVIEGTALDRFIAHAPVITDDFAPIDQWLREDAP